MNLLWFYGIGPIIMASNSKTRDLQISRCHKLFFSATQKHPLVFYQKYSQPNRFYCFPTMQPHIPLTDEEIASIWAVAQQFPAPRRSTPSRAASPKPNTTPRSSSTPSVNLLSSLREGALALLGSGQDSSAVKPSCDYRVPKNLRKTHDPYLPHIV